MENVRLHLLPDLIFVTNGSITHGPTYLLLLVWFKKSQKQKWDVWHFSDSQVKELFMEPFFHQEPPHILISPYIQSCLTVTEISRLSCSLNTSSLTTDADVHWSVMISTKLKSLNVSLKNSLKFITNLIEVMLQAATSVGRFKGEVIGERHWADHETTKSNELSGKKKSFLQAFIHFGTFFIWFWEFVWQLIYGRLFNLKIIYFSIFFPSFLCSPKLCFLKSSRFSSSP